MKSIQLKLNISRLMEINRDKYIVKWNNANNRIFSDINRNNQCYCSFSLPLGQKYDTIKRQNYVYLQNSVIVDMNGQYQRISFLSHQVSFPPFLCCLAKLSKTIMEQNMIFKFIPGSMLTWRIWHSYYYYSRNNHTDYMYKGENQWAQQKIGKKTLVNYVWPHEGKGGD